jgi:TIR domain
LKCWGLLYKPRVFISHSANEPETRKLCQAIDAGLRGGGFDVLWDADLATGQTWRAAIDEWIWKCDAAVLVLSSSALESKYVAYEAALLRQR